MGLIRFRPAQASLDRCSRIGKIQARLPREGEIGLVRLAEPLKCTEKGSDGALGLEVHGHNAFSDGF